MKLREVYWINNLTKMLIKKKYIRLNNQIKSIYNINNKRKKTQLKIRINTTLLTSLKNNSDILNINRKKTKALVSMNIKMKMNNDILNISQILALKVFHNNFFCEDTRIKTKITKNKQTLYTVLRSPFVYKKTREQLTVQKNVSICQITIKNMHVTYLNHFQIEFEQAIKCKSLST